MDTASVHQWDRAKVRAVALASMTAAAALLVGGTGGYLIRGTAVSTAVSQPAAAAHVSAPRSFPDTLNRVTLQPRVLSGHSPDSVNWAAKTARVLPGHSPDTQGGN